jgi:hypothetical protein
MLVPEGIDPGFQYNVGTRDRLREARRRLREKKALMGEI